MMVSQSFKDQVFTEQETILMDRLSGWVTQYQACGDLERSWNCAGKYLRVVNNATRRALASGTFTSDEQLTYGEVAPDYAASQAVKASGRKGIHLTLLLVEGSPLTQKVLALLEEDARGEHADKSRTL